MLLNVNRNTLIDNYQNIYLIIYIIMYIILDMFFYLNE